MKIRAAALLLACLLSACSLYPPKFRGPEHAPLYVPPADVDAWVIPDEVGYSLPCRSSSHSFPDRNFHCHTYRVNGLDLIVRRGDMSRAINCSEQPERCEEMRKKRGGNEPSTHGWNAAQATCRPGYGVDVPACLAARDSVLRARGVPLTPVRATPRYCGPAGTTEPCPVRDKSRTP